jgi:hypothetical protein
MPNWTQQELEELIVTMTKKSMTDAAFRKEVLDDATSALEKLAGKPLPDGMTLKCVERDPNYQSTFVLPDFVDGEKLDEESLSGVAGGIDIDSICFSHVGGLRCEERGKEPDWYKLVNTCNPHQYCPKKIDICYALA